MTQTQSQVKPQISETREARYPAIMAALQALRTTKGISDNHLHPLLDKALSEAKYYGDEAMTMLKRVLFHIGDVSRQHNILKQAGIQSSKGGAGERASFRSVMRWWEKAMPDDFYSKLKLFAEFTVLENLVYDEVRTDRMKGTLKSSEQMGFKPTIIADFFAKEIKSSKNPLIARHLPKFSSGKFRYSTNKKGKRYKRRKQDFTLKRELRQREFIYLLCEKLGWTVRQYKEYRKRQNTPEQLFSSKQVLNLSEDLVMKMFDSMTSSQRFRVAHMIAKKDSFGALKPKEKWGELGNLYIKWENRQTKIAEEIRNTDDPEKRKRVAKDLKVKSVGIQTIDLLADLARGKLSDDQINNTYQSMLEKMDIVGNVFPVIDGSHSMYRMITHNSWTERSYPIDNKYSDVDMFTVAVAMGIAFATRNPNPDYKNSFGWFSETFVIVGQSKYANKAPNPYVRDDSVYIERSDGNPVISDKYTFTENLRRAKQANPKIVSRTNIGATIEYFIGLHKRTKMPVEELPQALLFITDNEGNSGMNPKDFMNFANQYGWNPLVIFWGIKENSMTQYEGIPNCMFIGGFSENVLGQILRGITGGPIIPETELWSINDDVRYKLIE